VNTTLTIISLAIGGWGAIVATTLAVRQFRRDRRSLKVVCEPGENTSSAEGEGWSFDERLVRVRAINEGRRPVEVRHVRFRTEDGAIVQPVPVAGQPVLPELLGDGQCVTLLFDMATLEKDASHLAFAEVVDASQKQYLAPYPARG
jgi:hypothetical protein